MSLSEYRDPNAVVETAWLEEHLEDATLRIFDCTTHLKPAKPGSDLPYDIVSGKADYDAAHILGAGFLDLQEELSNNATSFRFMLPSAEQFAAAMSHHGVSDAHRVILYSAGGIMWATRVWWMLRAFGFDHVAVLNGGWEKWRAEGRPISTAPSSYPVATFTPRPRSGLFVDKDYVRARLGDGKTVMINALPTELHAGKTPSRYVRPGRVPGSVNVPAGELLDRETKTFVSLPDANDKFATAGVNPDKEVICYCGGDLRHR